MAVLGALQVAENGDLANWMIPPRTVGGVGGAMDIAACARRVIILMEHTTREGRPRLLRRCTYPLTAVAAVDLVITNLGVFAITDRGFELRDLAPGVTLGQVRSATEAEVFVPLKPSPSV